MVTALRWTAAGLLAASMFAGAIADSPPPHRELVLGGYHVLAADFHVHAFPLSWATRAPWDTVVEAQRQGLDAIAIVGHNHVWVSRVGRWFSRLVGGPVVLTGEEIVSPRYHLLAIGIQDTIGWRQPVASAIAEVHRQGGVAIAAHPTARYWPAYDAKAMAELDGAEVLHPLVYASAELAGQLRQFYGRAPLTAIGDSDYHGLGPVGLCRTYVFAKEVSEAGILDAVRHARTVVYDGGRAYGDARLIQLAGALRRSVPPVPFLGWFSRIGGVLGLGIAAIAGFKSQ